MNNFIIVCRIFNLHSSFVDFTVTLKKKIKYNKNVKINYNKI